MLYGLLAYLGIFIYISSLAKDINRCKKCITKAFQSLGVCQSERFGICGVAGPAGGFWIRSSLRIRAAGCFCMVAKLLIIESAKFRGFADRDLNEQHVIYPVKHFNQINILFWKNILAKNKKKDRKLTWSLKIYLFLNIFNSPYRPVKIVWCICTPIVVLQNAEKFRKMPKTACFA